MSTTSPFPQTIPYTIFIQTKKEMPFQAKFTNEDLLAYFQQYGEDITSDHIKGAAAHFQVQRQSLTKRMGKLPQ